MDASDRGGRKPFLRMVAGEVADRGRPGCPRGPRPGPLEAWRVLTPDPGLALAVADRVSVSLQGIAGRGPTGGRVTRPGRDDRDLIGARPLCPRSALSARPGPAAPSQSLSKEWRRRAQDRRFRTA